ncbi:MAG: phosphoglycerate dehydrogenase [Alphaproteobacteria bacterium]
MPKVLISDKMSPRAAEIFEERGIEVDVKPGMSPDELVEVIGAYDGLAIRSATKVTADVLTRASALKVVGRAGIGVDNVDVKEATSRGVIVMNTPFGNAITTAEHAIAMMMALARQIPEANASTHAGKWEKSRFMGVEVTGKTLGIIGCGNIGSIVADRALGLKMKVIAYDPFLSDERARDIGVQKVDLDTVLARADFISLHTPLTDQTRNILNKESLAKTRKGVRIINCARGGLVNEPDLKAALDSGHVSGAAFDVFETEPATENVLFGIENFIATPHLGASTSEAQENVALDVANQMADFLLTGAVVNAINMPSLSGEDAQRLKPYLVLAAQLGSFAGQVTESGIKSVRVEFEGHAAEQNTRPLVATLLEGLLKPLLDSVNIVNAPVMARERDIDVTEVKHEHQPDYQTLIRLTVETDTRTRSIAGTLVGGTKPRIVDIEGIAVEAELGRYMLFVRNADRPGFIGRLGTTLADHNVNIATFHLGRVKPGDDALCLVQVDEPLDKALIAALCALPDVMQVKSLTF